MTDTRVFVGTAGWSIPTRYAHQFSATGQHLVRYAAVLNGVEINTSFYRSHRRATYERWAGSVPDAFRFSVKIPKAMTHERKLIDCDALLDRFIGEVSGLGAKLGVLLVQLPPSLRFESKAADAFFATLRERTTVDVACEPRHSSWLTADAEALFEARRVARVAVDPAPVRDARDPGGWGGLVYLRLHGSPTIYVSDYDEAALSQIRARMAGYQGLGIPAWCIFDNTAAFHALGNALVVAGR